ncbi:ABC transporter substrate-binding protein [Paenibacillus sp. GSMTC-2017]|uniref:ABC transporter substrate-binding protein n=1 Tax=Paenibacillus sp. GSMTC-2017 TaxID=2794350 RepID=UPI0018D8D07C|nr:ABC transporter substrate-binding protein [Paenibacillus sp. GSMTC-2017]MBH5320842.1 ABC transporter substrate-binding protein [Paenibacillus sp. GSMTC-2017]
MGRCYVGALLLLLASILSGCSAIATEGSVKEGDHVLIDFADRKVAFSKIPERIIALGNGEVDIIQALGGTLVGRPQPNAALLPDSVKDIPVVGSAHTVDLEKIASLRPDVVLGNYPINSNDVPKLESIGTKTVLTQANSIADIRRQILLFGELLGKEEKATELIEALDSELQAIKGSQLKKQQRVLMVYGAPGTYLAALPNSLAGNLLETAGGSNMAAEFPRLQNFPQYAQLNTERVVEASPDVILIMTHGNSEEVEQGFVKEMEGNPAWSSLLAVQEGRIHVLPAELFGTNPGTRVADAVKLLGELLES